MSGTHTRNVDSVVYFANPVAGAELPRLLHALRIALARRGLKMKTPNHIPGRFIEFEAGALRGSLFLSSRPLTEAIWSAQTDTREGASAKALRIALGEHRAHLHIFLTGDATADLALRAILRASFGCFAAAGPLAMWHGQEMSLFSPAEAADHLDIGLTTPHEVANIFAPRASAKPAVNGHAVPRKVALPAKGAQRARPDADTGLPARSPDSALDRILATLRAREHLSGAALARVSAGVLFGLLISGWVNSTVGPTVAYATTYYAEAVTALDDK